MTSSGNLLTESNMMKYRPIINNGLDAKNNLGSQSSKSLSPNFDCRTSPDEVRGKNKDSLNGCRNKSNTVCIDHNNKAFNNCSNYAADSNYQYYNNNYNIN